MDTPLSQLSEQERERALEHFRIIRPFLEEGKALTQIARDHQLPLRTLRRWAQQYRAEGLVGLGRTPRRDQGTHRLLSPELQRCVEGLALQKPPLSIATIHRQVSELAQKRNEAAPSYAVVYRIVRSLSSALTTLAQEGEKAYSQRFDLLHRREAEAPNAIWQADHCLLDIFLVREGQEPARPWLTVIEDDYSRAIAGYYREVPSPNGLVALLNTVAQGRRAKVLLFTNSRRECDSLGAALRGQTAFGNHVFVHHSSLDREVRLDTEQAFLKAPIAFCIATSTLEIGIDIGDIDLVMLYSHPGGWESFLQRVGRGNRRSEKTNVVCIVSSEHGSTFSQVLAFEATVRQILEGRLERERPLAIYGAAAQQVLSTLVAAGGAFTRTADLADLMADWPYLDRPTVEELLNGLARAGYVVGHGFQHRYGAGEELHRLHDLRLIWGNFPLRSRDVRVSVSGRQLGIIPATNLL